MPEGPEMRRAADELARVLAGRVARSVWFKFERLGRAGRALSGRRVRGVSARGKALIVHFAGGRSIYTHNQLYGKWLVGPAGTRPATTRDLRIAIETDEHAALLYSASEIDVLPSRQIDGHPYVAKLGVELLDPATTVPQVIAQIRAQRFARRPLGVLLLDQAFLSGVGNYLRSEILFFAGLHPDRRPQGLDAREQLRLARAALSITRRAYRTRGITNDAARARALKARGLTYGQYRHAVFDRRDADCYDCATRGAVRRIVNAGRQLYLCEVCQPDSSATGSPKGRTLSRARPVRGTPR
jgi:endonuclease VIII